MMKFPRVGAFAILVLVVLAGAASAAQSMDAASWAKRGEQAFTQGDFKQAANSYEHAVKMEVENPEYLEALGRSYEREAEQSALPMFLTRKARISFQRALRIDPNNVAALQDLSDLEQQPIGLCGGNLSEAALLNDHLATIDPDAAAREQWLHADAVHEDHRPGQRVLCAPVKVVRLVVDPIMNPRRSVLAAKDLSSSPAPDAVVSQNANADTLAQGQ
jgi:tetratricopeptide (TPR) repeat protein